MRKLFFLLILRLRTLREVRSSRNRESEGSGLASGWAAAGGSACLILQYCLSSKSNAPSQEPSKHQTRKRSRKRDKFKGLIWAECHTDLVENFAFHFLAILIHSEFVQLALGNRNCLVRKYPVLAIAGCFFFSLRGDSQLAAQWFRSTSC